MAKHILPMRTERAVLEQLLYDSVVPTLRILHAPTKRKLPQGECITAEIRWVGAKEGLDSIYRNLRTKDYLLPDATRILADDVWAGLEPINQGDTYILRIVLIDRQAVPQASVVET